MKAKLVLREKYVFSDGSIVEMVLWKLPQKTHDRPHGIKYRLFYGLSDGSCSVRYDNEIGKGDHKHYGNREEEYHFSSVDTLLSDFLRDVSTIRSEENDD